MSTIECTDEGLIGYIWIYTSTSRYDDEITGYSSNLFRTKEGALESMRTDVCESLDITDFSKLEDGELEDVELLEVTPSSPYALRCDTHNVNRKWWVAPINVSEGSGWESDQVHDERFVE